MWWGGRDRQTLCCHATSLRRADSRPAPLTIWTDPRACLPLGILARATLGIHLAPHA